MLNSKNIKNKLSLRLHYGKTNISKTPFQVLQYCIVLVVDMLAVFINRFYFITSECEHIIIMDKTQMHRMKRPMQNIIEDDIERILIFHSTIYKLRNHIQGLETNVVFIKKKIKLLRRRNK